MKRFVEGQDRSQLILLPDCLDDYVGEEGLSRCPREAHMMYSSLAASHTRRGVRGRQWPGHDL